MNIKNLAREVLDIDPYFPRLQGIDHRSRFQWQVNFGADLRNAIFSLKTASEFKKAFLRSKSRFLKKFSGHYQMIIYGTIHPLRPLEHLQTPQGPFRSFWKHFEKIQFFEFSKKNLRYFLTVLAYFWRLSCILSSKNRFFQKVRWISKIWPEKF